MISQQQIDLVLGATAVATDGELGPVGEVYLDDSTGQPEWVAVHTGRVGTWAAFVPLTEAELDGDTLRLPYTAATVRSAPHHDVQVEGHLAAAEEADLLHHYGLDSERAVAEAVGTVDGPGPPRPARRASGRGRGLMPG